MILILSVGRVFEFVWYKDASHFKLDSTPNFADIDAILTLSA